MMGLFRTWAQCLLWSLLVTCLSAFVVTAAYFLYRGLARG